MIAHPAPTSLVDAKARLRAEALARRRAVSNVTRLHLAERLVREGLHLARRWRPLVISAFHPLRDEPDTLPLIAALALDGFSTALPVTLSRAAPLRFRLWKPGDALIRGQMNIAEPPPEATEVEPDLLFAPLAAFDRSGHRIGYGAGHYDRVIAVLRGRKPVHAVGVAFATSEVEAIPSEPHDEALDAILTETETIFPRGAP